MKTIFTLSKCKNKELKVADPTKSGLPAPPGRDKMCDLSQLLFRVILTNSFQITSDGQIFKFHVVSRQLYQNSMKHLENSPRFSKQLFFSIPDMTTIEFTQTSVNNKL